MNRAIIVDGLVKNFEVLENMSKPCGWLMERFVINTPQTFLRYMVNLISGEDFIFSI